MGEDVLAELGIERSIVKLRLLDKIKLRTQGFHNVNRRLPVSWYVWEIIDVSLHLLILISIPGLLILRALWMQAVYATTVAPADTAVIEWYDAVKWMATEYNAQSLHWLVFTQVLCIVNLTYNIT